MRRRLLLWTLELCTPIALLAIWQALTVGNHSIFFPSLSNILRTFGRVWFSDQFVTEALPSIERMLIGFAVAVVGGVTLGVALGLWKVFDQTFGLVIEYIRSIPPVALIPFGIVVLGLGTTMKVFIIAIGALFPVLLNTIDGVRSVDRTLLDVARVYRFNRRERLFQIMLPAASPQIFAGLRSALSLSLILMVVSEMVASTNGIGFSVLHDQRVFAIPEMWAGIVLLGLLGYILNALLLLVERGVLAWHRGYRAAVTGV